MKQWRSISIFASIVAIFIVCVLMIFCFTPKVSEDMIEYVRVVKAKKQPYHQEIPVLQPDEEIRYSANAFRDPFVPYRQSIKEKILPVTKRPDWERPREPLESYALETLTMVGTMKKSNTFYVLIKDQSGIVHRLGIGNYLGKNSGKIRNILESEIEIQELMSDNKGGWQETPIKLHLKQNMAGSFK